MGQRWTWRGLAAGLLLVVCAAAHAGDTTDMARFMPAETALYVGWSSWYEVDAPEVQAGRRAAEASFKMISAMADEDELAWLPEAAGVMSSLSTRAGGLGLFDVRLTEESVDIQVALLIHGGPVAEETDRLLRTIVRSQQLDWPLEERTVAGVAFQAVPIPETPLTLLWGMHKDCFLLTLGETAAERVIACLNGDAPTLADAEELQFDRRKVAARLDGRHACIYVDPPRIITRAREVATELMGELPPIVDQVLTELGIGVIKSKYLHVDEVNKTPRMMAFAHLDGPPRGLLALWNQQPLSEDDLKIIPRDAYWAEVGNLDLTALWVEVTRIIEALAPEQAPGIQGALAMSRQMLGFSLTDDLLPALGNTWAVFDAPDHGGLLLTGTVLVAEAQDTAVIDGVLQRVVQMVGGLVTQESDGIASLELREIEHGGHKIRYVLIAGLPVPVAPAWGFVGDRWVFGLFPQTVAAAMQQVDPATRGESILDRADVQAARAHLPAEFMGFAYYDSRYLARLFYPLANASQMIGTSLAARHGATVDFVIMPPVAEFAAKTTNFIGTSSRDSDGIVYASVGHGTPLLVAVGAVSGTTAVLLPSLSRAREQAKHAVSMSNLRGIAQGCIVYAVDHEDRFPASFDELVDGGIITRAILTAPFDEEGEVSYVLVPRTKPVFRERDPARMVLAYEKMPHNGYVCAAFVDGHVERLPVERFAEVLAETYRALELDEEIPPQFRY